MKRFLGLILAAAMIMVMGCTEMGKDIQGRVIGYDKDAGKVTFLEDKSLTPGKPDYAPTPVVFTIPADPSEMGAVPAVGYRVNLDTDKRTLTLYDRATGKFNVIAYELKEMKENINKDNELVAGKTFPIVDRDAATIQIYSGRQKRLVTFTLPRDYFAEPDANWAAGDEIRIYYKEFGKALRMMNITKTDIFKK